MLPMEQQSLFAWCKTQKANYKPREQRWMHAGDCLRMQSPQHRERWWPESSKRNSVYYSFYLFYVVLLLLLESISIVRKNMKSLMKKIFLLNKRPTLEYMLLLLFLFSTWLQIHIRSLLYHTEGTGNQFLQELNAIRGWYCKIHF